MDNDIYKRILCSIDEGVYFVDTERKITFWNKGAEKITGFSAKDVVGSYCYDNILNHIDDAGNHLCFSGCPLHATIADGESRNVNVYLHHKEGHRVPVTVRSVQISENNEVIGAVELFSDNSEYYKITKNLEELTSIALHDQLTELPNRRYLETYIQSKLIDLQLLHINFGAIFIDIDHFKIVNDTYGHSIGDEVLKMVSKTLQGALRKSDIIARNGGEEFVAVFPIDTIESLSAIADKLRVLIANSVIRTKGHDIQVTVSLGATMALQDDNFVSILDRADRLMYNSKSQGRNQVTSG